MHSLRAPTGMVEKVKKKNLERLLDDGVFKENEVLLSGCMGYDEKKIASAKGGGVCIKIRHNQGTRQRQHNEDNAASCACWGDMCVKSALQLSGPEQNARAWRRAAEGVSPPSPAGRGRAILLNAVCQHCGRASDLREEPTPQIPSNTRSRWAAEWRHRIEQERTRTSDARLCAEALQRELEEKTAAHLKSQREVKRLRQLLRHMQTFVAVWKRTRSKPRRLPEGKTNPFQEIHFAETIPSGQARYGYEAVACRVSATPNRCDARDMLITASRPHGAPGVEHYCSPKSPVCDHSHIATCIGGAARSFSGAGVTSSSPRVGECGGTGNSSGGMVVPVSNVREGRRGVLENSDGDLHVLNVPGSTACVTRRVATLLADTKILVDHALAVENGAVGATDQKRVVNVNQASGCDLLRHTKNVHRALSGATQCSGGPPSSTKRLDGSESDTHRVCVSSSSLFGGGAGCSFIPGHEGISQQEAPDVGQVVVDAPNGFDGVCVGSPQVLPRVAAADARERCLSGGAKEFNQSPATRCDTSENDSAPPQDNTEQVAATAADVVIRLYRERAKHRAQARNKLKQTREMTATQTALTPSVDRWATSYGFSDDSLPPPEEMSIEDSGSDDSGNWFNS